MVLVIDALRAQQWQWKVLLLLDSHHKCSHFIIHLLIVPLVSYLVSKLGHQGSDKFLK